MTRQRLKTILYNEVEADVETEADANGNAYQTGYAVGFNDCRSRALEALVRELGLREGCAESNKLLLDLYNLHGPKEVSCGKIGPVPPGKFAKLSAKEIVSWKGVADVGLMHDVAKHLAKY